MSSLLRSLTLSFLAVFAASACQSAAPLPATTTPDASVLTVVNVLESPSGEQARLVRLLNEGIETSITSRPGFVSATVHRSLDSNHVVVYAQWQDADALAAVAEHVSQGKAPKMAEAFELGSPDFHPYELVSTYGDDLSIAAERDVLTVVNVMVPPADKQQQLVALLQEGIGTTMSKQNGFLSAAIHRSLDSEHVVVYAQWRSAQDLQQAATLVETGGAPSMASAYSLGAPQFHPYEVVMSHRTAH